MLRNIVRELRIQDDLKCRAIAEIAIKQDISYEKAEKMMNAEYKKAQKITNGLLREGLLCTTVS